MILDCDRLVAKMCVKLNRRIISPHFQPERFCSQTLEIPHQFSADPASSIFSRQKEAPNVKNIFLPFDQIKTHRLAAFKKDGVLCIFPCKTIFELLLIRHMELTYQGKKRFPDKAVDKLFIFISAGPLCPYGFLRTHYLKLGSRTPFIITFWASRNASRVGTAASVKAAIITYMGAPLDCSSYSQTISVHIR